jgi:hypothetical protein
MIGKNPLWVAKQHGHSVQTLLETYAAWLEGTTGSDLRAIKQAMEAPAARSITESETAEHREGHAPDHAVTSPGIPRSCHWKRNRSCNCLTTGSNYWRRERDSNRIQRPSRTRNLLNRNAIRSPLIPGNPRSCH